MNYKKAFTLMAVLLKETPLLSAVCWRHCLNQRIPFISIYEYALRIKNTITSGCNQFIIFNTQYRAWCPSYFSFELVRTKPGGTLLGSLGSCSTRFPSPLTHHIAIETGNRYIRFYIDTMIYFTTPTHFPPFDRVGSIAIQTPAPFSLYGQVCIWPVKLVA